MMTPVNLAIVPPVGPDDDVPSAVEPMGGEAVTTRGLILTGVPRVGEYVILETTRGADQLRVRGRVVFVTWREDDWPLVECVATEAERIGQKGS